VLHLFFLREVSMLCFFPGVEKAVFLSRPNRFVVRARYKGETVLCHMPNPGRMRELLLPGVTLFVMPHRGTKTRFRVVGVRKEHVPVMLDTQRNNDIAAWLIDHQKIPGWEGWRVIRREVTMGDSRFDLLLGDDRGHSFPVEVKSCTLFGKKGAMFPDAVTARGCRHVKELTAMAKSGKRAGVLVLVHGKDLSWFLPDFHTDPAFADAFKDSMPYVEWKIAETGWHEDLTMEESVRLLPVPLSVLNRENQDRGETLFIWRLENEETWDGQTFQPGYYIWCRRVERNLEKTVRHYRNHQKTLHGFLDELRHRAECIYGIPIRSSEDLTPRFRQGMDSMGCQPVPGTGEVYYSRSNPWDDRRFVTLWEDMEIDHLSLE
jgi:sugar fermentation stimulation protein A